MSLRVRVSVPGRPLIDVRCASPAQCAKVAEVERAASYVRREGASIGLHAKRPDGGWEPLVLWIYYDERWHKELF